MRRQDIVTLTGVKNPVGIELGIAEGELSHRIVSSTDVEHWYSVDWWSGDRGHDVNEYKTTLRKLLPYRSKSTVLRMKFEEALDLFPAEFFDIIYVDGYAHTGQEDGKTLRDWFPKLKKGGVFSGDDYHPKWPKTVEQVDLFAEQQGLELKVFNFTDGGNWGTHPSWYITKD